MPLYCFSQTYIGPIIGYDIAALNVGELKTPFGPPQTKGFENGSFLCGLKIARKFKEDYLLSLGTYYTRKKVGENGDWSNYYSYYSICNSVVIEKQLKNVIYLGVGLAHLYNGGFNFVLSNQSSNENHLGMVLTSSYHCTSFSFNLRYNLYWNLNRSEFEHIRSAKSLEFTVSYMLNLK